MTSHRVFDVATVEGRRKLVARELGARAGHAGGNLPRVPVVDRLEMGERLRAALDEDQVACRAVDVVGLVEGAVNVAGVNQVVECALRLRGAGNRERQE